MSERIWDGLRKNALYKSTYTLLYFTWLAAPRCGLCRRSGVLDDQTHRRREQVASVEEYQWYMYHDTKKVSSIKYHDTFLVAYQYQYHWYILTVSVSKIADAWSLIHLQGFEISTKNALTTWVTLRLNWPCWQDTVESRKCLSNSVQHSRPLHL